MECRRYMVSGVQAVHGKWSADYVMLSGVQWTVSMSVGIMMLCEVNAAGWLQTSTN